MAFGLAQLVLIGLLVSYLTERLRLPGLVGLLATGIILGPYVLDQLSLGITSVSADLRMIALIVILLRAGFGLSRKELQKVGFRAILMAFIPCVCEVALITVAAPFILGITYLEAAMLGSVLAAVSPAVIVPHMIELIDKRRGTNSGVPTLILAGASCDDAVAIVLCTSLTAIYVGSDVSLIRSLVSIPVSVVTGITAGIIIGFLCYRLFIRFNPRATKRTLIIIGIAITLLTFEEVISTLLPFSALIAVMTIGLIIFEKDSLMASEISSKLGKVWVFAGLLLFTLIGSEVNLPVALEAGVQGVSIIFIGLLGRSAGVQLSLAGSHFSFRERLFISLAYLPKATVQAAIGSYPLLAMKAASMPTGLGELILAIAVLSIIITAPLGSALIRWTAEPLLHVESGTLANAR